MTTEEKIKVMQAFVNGKQIQILCVNDWKDIDPTKELVWDWNYYSYRIKPEEKKPTYRPYNDAEEMIADYKERAGIAIPPHTMALPLVWLKRKNIDEYNVITDFGYVGVCLATVVYSYEDLLGTYTYLDGSPVGKLVEK